MFRRLKYKLRRGAQRLALGTFGAVLLLAGLGFFSASALMLLLTMTDPITACAIMGGAFAGIGLVAIAIAQISADEHETAQLSASAQKDEMPPLAAAFMQGMAQGMSVRQRAS